jgi:LysR family transcriptional regulator, glycine cleavage system transcriptional activator
MTNKPSQPLRPSLKLLAGFEAAARSGSFAEAASEMGVSRSAISHQIRELEDHLGVSLFVRTDGKPRLTEAGVLLARHVTAGMAEIRRGLETLSAQNMTRRISLSAPPFFASRFLRPHQSPLIDLNLIVESRHADFDTSDVDAAVRFGDGRWPGLRAEKLVSVRYAPVCAPRLRASADDDGTLLAHGARLSFAGEGSGWDAIDRTLPLARSAAAKTIVYDGFLGALHACLEGQGVMLAPIDLLTDYIERDRLVQITEESFPSTNGFHVVAPPARFEQPEIILLRRWLANAVKTQAVAETPA